MMINPWEMRANEAAAWGATAADRTGPAIVTSSSSSLSAYGAKDSPCRTAHAPHD